MSTSLFSSIFLLTLSTGEIIQINDGDFNSIEECLISNQKEAENFSFYIVDPNNEYSDKARTIDIDGACVKHKKGQKIKLPKDISERISKIYQAENMILIHPSIKLEKNNF